MKPNHLAGPPMTLGNMRGFRLMCFPARAMRCIRPIGLGRVGGRRSGPPHPFDDLDTESEAVEAFLALGARTLLIAGTDRDQNTPLAPCDQSSRPYLEADV